MTDITNQTYTIYINALIDGDSARCTQIVKEMSRSAVGQKDMYINLFQRSLYQIGELWEHHKISVAVEHLATAITERLLAIVEPQIFTRTSRERKAIIACVADEYHQLGGRMVADIFEMHGWRGYFLGANTPISDLLELIDKQKPDLVALSLSIYMNLSSLLKALDALENLYPDLNILVGGQAFRWGGTDSLKSYPMVSYINSLDELEQKIEEYSGT